MVTKEAAMSFSQFGYPYNATSQVRASAFFISLKLLCTRALTRTHIALTFFYLIFLCIFSLISVKSEHFFPAGNLHVWLLWQYWQLFFFFSQRAAFVVEPNIDRHAAVSNYTELWMNSRVFLMTIEMNVTYCSLRGVFGLQRMLHTFARNFLFKSLGRAGDKCHHVDSV